MTDLTPPSPPQPDPPADPRSPRWTAATKFLVSLAAFALVAWLVARFGNLAGPVIFCIILTYLLSPAAEWLQARLGIAWGAAVNLTYLTLVVVILLVLTGAGIAIEQQIVGLYRAGVEISADLPGFLDDVVRRTLQIGPSSAARRRTSWA